MTNPLFGNNPAIDPTAGVTPLYTFWGEGEVGSFKTSTDRLNAIVGRTRDTQSNVSINPDNGKIVIHIPDNRIGDERILDGNFVGGEVDDEGLPLGNEIKKIELGLEKITKEDGNIMNIEEIENILLMSPNQFGYKGNRQLIKSEAMETGVMPWAKSIFEEMRTSGMEELGLDPDPESFPITGLFSNQQDYSPVPAEAITSMQTGELGDKELEDLFTQRSYTSLSRKIANTLGLKQFDDLQNVNSTTLVDNLDIIGSSIGAIGAEALSKRFPISRLPLLLKPLKDKLSPAFEGVRDTIKHIPYGDKAFNFVRRSIDEVSENVQGAARWLWETPIGDGVSFLTTPTLYLAKKTPMTGGSYVGGAGGSLLEDFVEQGYPDTPEKFEVFWDKAKDTGKQMAILDLGGTALFDGIWKLGQPFAKKYVADAPIVAEMANKIRLLTKGKPIGHAWREHKDMPVMPSGMKGQEPSWIEKIIETYGWGTRTKKQYSKLIELTQQDPSDVNSLLHAIFFQGSEHTLKSTGKGRFKVVDGKGALLKEEEKNGLDLIMEAFASPDVKSSGYIAGQRTATDKPKLKSWVIDGSEFLDALNKLKKDPRFKNVPKEIIQNAENFGTYLMSQSRQVDNFIKGQLTTYGGAIPKAPAAIVGYHIIAPMFQDERDRFFWDEDFRKSPQAKGIFSTEVGLGPAPFSVSGEEAIMAYGSYRFFKLLTTSMIKKDGYLNQLMTDGVLKGDTMKNLLKWAIPIELKAIQKFTGDQQSEDEPLSATDYSPSWQKTGRVGGHLFDQFIEPLSGAFSKAIPPADASVPTGEPPQGLLDILSTLNPNDIQAKVNQTPDKDEYNQIIEELKKGMRR